MSGTEASATKEGLRQDGSKNWIVSFASPDRSAIRKSGFRFAAEALFDPSAAGDGSFSRRRSIIDKFIAPYRAQVAEAKASFELFQSLHQSLFENR